MTAKKRKPKAIRGRTVTEATKAKLPRPKRKRPPGTTPSPIAGQPLDGIGTVPAPDLTATPCASDSWVAGHKAWQAKAGIPDVVTTVDGMTWSNASTTRYVLRFPNGSTHDLPVTEPYPWPVRVLWWLDEAPAKARRRIAAWLRALARKVEPT